MRSSFGRFFFIYKQFLSGQNTVSKMVRPPKIVETTVGRLTETTKEDLQKRKKLTLHQKQKIVELCKSSSLKDLGLRLKCRKIFQKLDLKLSKDSRLVISQADFCPQLTCNCQRLIAFRKF